MTQVSFYHQPLPIVVIFISTPTALILFNSRFYYFVLQLGFDSLLCHIPYLSLPSALPPEEHPWSLSFTLHRGSPHSSKRTTCSQAPPKPEPPPHWCPSPTPVDSRMSRDLPPSSLLILQFPEKKPCRSSQLPSCDSFPAAPLPGLPYTLTLQPHSLFHNILFPLRWTERSCELPAWHFHSPFVWKVSCSFPNVPSSPDHGHVPPCSCSSSLWQPCASLY